MADRRLPVKTRLDGAARFVAAVPDDNAHAFRAKRKLPNKTSSAAAKILIILWLSVWLQLSLYMKTYLSDQGFWKASMPVTELPA
jgi:hypothetical protein